jgi:uncharacterized protein (TIGR02145 family)
MIMKKGVNLISLLCLISAVILIQGCKKSTVPAITTVEVSGVTLNTAVSGGEITSDGGEAVIDKGVCWNTTGDPTLSDSKTSDGEGSESFISNLASLQQGTVYYVRAYATNAEGTAYGESITFSTQIIDVDGNKYNTTPVGLQLWMAENLKTTKYKDNSQIPNVTSNATWSTLTTHAYCWANNDMATYKPLYGAIYNWYAVKSGKLCPAGWHAPTDADFKTLEISLGMTQAQADGLEWRGTDQGKQLKNTTGWNTGENGTNTIGFAALPGGYRAYATGICQGIGLLSYWWTASEQDENTALYRRLDGNNDKAYKGATYKRAGKYVRCVKD